MSFAIACTKSIIRGTHRSLKLNARGKQTERIRFIFFFSPFGFLAPQTPEKSITITSFVPTSLLNKERLLISFTFYFSLPVTVGGERELFEGRTFVTLVVDGDGKAISEKKKKKTIFNENLGI